MLGIIVKIALKHDYATVCLVCSLEFRVTKSYLGHAEPRQSQKQNKKLV